MHLQTRSRRSCIWLFAIAVALLVPSSASADTTWTKISSDYFSNITIPEIGILGSTAVLTWEQDTSPSTQDIVSDTFQTSPANDVANGVPGKVADGWAEVDRTQAIVPTPSGGLQIAFGGIHSTNSADPLIGLIGSTYVAGGTWTPPATIATGEGDTVWSGVLSGTVPIYAGNGAGSISILANPTSPASTRVADLEAQLEPGVDGYAPKVARDAMGRVWVAWYSSGGAHTGIYVQQVDGTTGQPIGAPAFAPASENIDNNSFGVALACAATCRVVYGDAPSGGTTDLLVSWWIGESSPTTIANLAGTGETAGRVVSDAYRADGKLWVAWWNGKSYSYELGDANGAGGSVQDAGLPAGGGTGAYALDVAAVGDNLLMAANFNYKSGQNIFAIFVNTVAPPAPVTYAPGPRQTDVVATPGGKGFRIQVQYRVPAICKPTCAAHAELRTRDGRQQYAVSKTAPLPGDGKIVLGTRASVKLPGGKKVRFYITISKAELLKAPFTTVGGNRVANTRLRVWLTTKSGQQLTVRDGRIAVSIARIKSGALPGLAGIL
jgi:hypothetical protein